MAPPPEISTPPLGTDEYDAWATQDKGPAITIMCWLFTVIATVFVCGRVFVRLRMYSRLRDDDCWCIGGLICSYLTVSLTQVAVSHGNGKHFSLLSDDDKQTVILWTTIAFCPGILSFGLPKLAVVSLLTRLLNPGRLHKFVLWFMVVWCLLTLLAVTGTLLGQCQPAESQWNFDIEGTCVEKSHIVNFSLYAGTYSAFVDFYLAIYPAIVLFRLQMKLRKKLALAVALGIGLVSGIVAIYKTTRIPNGLTSPDFSYDSSDLIIWTVIEGSTLIMACSIPVLSPLFDLIFGRNPFQSSPTSRRKGQEGGGGGDKYDPNQQHQRHPSHPSKSNISGGSRSHHRMRPENPYTLMDVELEETIVGGGSSTSSQEVIMLPKQSREFGVTAEARYSNFSHPRSPRGFTMPQDVISPVPQGHIVRTDEVRVSYASPSEFDFTSKASRSLSSRHHER